MANVFVFREGWDGPRKIWPSPAVADLDNGSVIRQFRRGEIVGYNSRGERRWTTSLKPGAEDQVVLDETVYELRRARRGEDIRVLEMRMTPDRRERR